MSGEKTQTRRLHKPTHSSLPRNARSVLAVKTHYQSRGKWRSRTLWTVGKTYAVQPPGEPGTQQRGGKSIGRIIIKGIHLEPLQDISDEDLILEGFVCYEDIGGAVLDELLPDRESYIENWDEMYRDEPDYQWDKNPTVYVIDFEKV